MRRSTFLLFGILIGACNTDTFTGDDGGTDTGPDVPGVGGGDGSTDAPSDAGPGKEAGPQPRFCQSVDAQFCADFDIPNDASAGFQKPPPAGGFTLDFTQNNAKSLPLSLKTSEPGDAAGSAFLTTVLGATVDAGAATSITLDLDVALPPITQNATQALFVFGIGAASPNYEFGLANDGKQWKLENFVTSTGPQLNGPVITGAWSHATLEVALSPTAGTVTLTVTQGSNVAVASMQAITAPGSGSLPVMLTVGLTTNGPANQPASFLYDNVVVHYQ
jgi:hypothetical protein